MGALLVNRLLPRHSERNHYVTVQFFQKFLRCNRQILYSGNCVTLNPYVLLHATKGLYRKPAHVAAGKHRISHSNFHNDSPLTFTFAPSFKPNFFLRFTGAIISAMSSGRLERSGKTIAPLTWLFIKILDAERPQKV